MNLPFASDAARAVSTAAKHLDVVGAPRDASPSTLKRAYRARALRMHPDKSKAPDAEDRFRELQAAYDASTATMKQRMEDLTGGLNLNLPGMSG